MKVFVMVPTGEIRKVKFREYYKLGYNILQFGECGSSVEDYPIYKSVPIDLHDDANKISLNEIYHQNKYMCSYPINLPKPRVKKWRWRVWVLDDKDKAMVTEKHFTEEEMKNFWSNMEKIEGTEVEE